MIVVDSSALIAVLDEEPEQISFSRAIYRADRTLLNASNFQETGHVIFARLGARGLQELDALVKAMKIEIVPHDEELSRRAIEAFRRFGKGIHPKARLNLGDCAAYALAMQTGAPLLFKGNDFDATDVVACVPPSAG